MSELSRFIISEMEKYPNSYLMEQDKKQSYSEVLATVNTLEKEAGWSLFSERKCAVLCKSSMNMAIIMIALWNVNAVVVPLSMNYGKIHCENILETTRPNVLISDDILFIKEFCGEVECKVDEHFLSAKLYWNEEDKELDNISLIMCTSGTTGNPKGVMLYGQGLVKNVLGILDYFDINQEDTILIARPLYHGAVLTGELLVSLCRGLHVIFYSDVFNPRDIKRQIEQYKVSVLCGTPTLMHHLSFLFQLSHKDNPLRVIAVSGECLIPEVAKNLRSCFKKTKIYNVYGLTEASPRVSYLPYEEFDSHPEAVGIPLKDTVIKIIKENGEELGKNQKGQILVQSPSLMKGYYNNPQISEKKIVDGWLHTGDIGYIDDMGYLYIISRMDDMIIKAGMNIYPIEIENEIEKIEEVRSVLVYGRKGNMTEEIVVDIVLREFAKKMSKKELFKKIAAVLPAYKMPSIINIVEELPRNASGKIIRPKKK